jgi:hypothetical protein
VVSFSAVAFLLAPADPMARAVTVEADPRWRLDRAAVEGAGAVMAGRGPLPAGTGLFLALRRAAARERFVGRLRLAPPQGLRTLEVVRLPPPAIRPGRLRAAGRRALLSGAAVVMARPEFAGWTVLDAVLAAAGADRVGPVRPGSGGSVLARVRLRDDRDGILRAGVEGTEGDPTEVGRALALLQPLGIAAIPRLLEHGRTAGVAWTIEALLPGRRPRRITSDLAAALGTMSATLPRRSEVPTSVAEDLRRIAAHLPETAPALGRVAEMARRDLAVLPAILRHGDLWAGNLLVEGGRLSGVVDWGAWHPSGVPGADLLHVVATERSHRSRKSLGQVWLEQPWRWPRYEELTRPYWASLGISPNRSALRAVGIAWWACQVAGSLDRLSHLAGDRRWVSRNVDLVLARLSD